MYAQLQSFPTQSGLPWGYLGSQACILSPQAPATHPESYGPHLIEEEAMMRLDQEEARKTMWKFGQKKFR